MRCPRCGAALESEVPACPECGAKAVVTETTGDAADASGDEAPDAMREALAAARDEGADDAVPEDALPPTASDGVRAPEVLHFRVAGFFERLLAGLVDGVIILPLFALLAWGGSALTGVRIPRAREVTFDLIVGLLIEKNGPVIFWAVMLVILVFLYCFIFVAARGQTPGKRLVGVRVVTWYGEPPTLARSLLRTVGYLLSAGLLWLGFIWIGFDREKRGLHDWIAGTYVVRS
jgi:uncharacterized RDD family membrane protein YckC